jgi:cytochrome c oxidase assembly protein subunit 15
MGTQVREAIDSVAATGVERSGWIEALPAWWKGHRTASWAVLALHAVWLIPAVQRSQGPRLSVAGAVAAVLVGQMLTGVLFVYAGMPSWAQPIHLLLGVLLVACDVWMLLRLQARSA